MLANKVGATRWGKMSPKLLSVAFFKTCFKLADKTYKSLPSEAPYGTFVLVLPLK
jgi:hypothetical protein